jgi:putative membrane protein
MNREKGVPMMWGYGGFGFLWMALLLIGVTFLVVWTVRRPEEKGPGGNRALELLKERYARGELEDDEFTTHRRQLLG